MAFTRLHVTVFLGVASATWGGVLFAQGVPLGLEHVAPFSTVVAVLAALGTALEYRLWRLPALHGWFVARPDLRGTWRVTLQSDWVDQATNEQVPPINCFFGVEQTLSKLQMHLMTPESESWFVAHSVRPSPSESGYQVVGVYTNQPHVHLRAGRSRSHLGGLVLSTHGPSKGRPASLDGEYWTDRKTTGRMTLTERVDTVCTRYEDAVTEFD